MLDLIVTAAAGALLIAVLVVAALVWVHMHADSDPRRGG